MNWLAYRSKTCALFPNRAAAMHAWIDLESLGLNLKRGRIESLETRSIFSPVLLRIPFSLQREGVREAIEINEGEIVQSGIKLLDMNLSSTLLNHRWAYAIAGVVGVFVGLWIAHGIG